MNNCSMFYPQILDYDLDLYNFVRPQFTSARTKLECPDKPFQPSLMFASKARPYASEALHSRVGPCPYPQTTD